MERRTRVKTKKSWSDFLMASGILIGAIIVICVLICSGCSMAPRAVRVQAAAIQPDETGLVDVVFVNPNLGIYGHVFMFDGNEEVKIIPDARTRGWMFNRPAIAEFKIDPAYGLNWWKEKWFKLPINHTYTLFVVGERFWGAIVDRPYAYFLRTGDNPFASQYWRHSPRGGLVNCGGFLQLPTFYNYSGPMNLEIVITPGDYMEAGFHTVGKIFGGR